MSENHNRVTHEEVQAQIAAFASNEISNVRNRDYVLSRMGSIAFGPVVDVVRTTSDTEYERSPHGNLVTPAGTDIVAGSAEEYLRYIGDTERSRAQIAERVRLLKNYRLFDRLIDESTEHLGSGTNADVRRVVRDGRGYAVRTLWGVSADAADPYDTPAPNVEHKVRASILGLGIPHLEQLVAINYEKGRTVSEIMPGVELPKLPATELEHQVTDEQIDAFIETIVAAYRAGIAIDPKPSNIFYDPEQGFGVIDYHARAVVPGRRETTLADTIANGAYAIAGAGIDGKRLSDPTYRDYARQQRASSLLVLERFRARCRARFGEDESGDVIDAILQERVDKHRALVALL